MPVKKKKVDILDLVVRGAKQVKTENTFVYIHGSDIQRTKLEMVNDARMQKNPFLAAMEEKYKLKVENK